MNLLVNWKQDYTIKGCKMKKSLISTELVAHNFFLISWGINLSTLLTKNIYFSSEYQGTPIKNIKRCVLYEPKSRCNKLITHKQIKHQNSNIKDNNSDPLYVLLYQQKRRNVHQPSFFHLFEVQTTNGDASRSNNVEIWAWFLKRKKIPDEIPHQESPARVQERNFSTKNWMKPKKKKEH